MTEAREEVVRLLRALDVLDERPCECVYDEAACLELVRECSRCIGRDVLRLIFDSVGSEGEGVAWNEVSDFMPYSPDAVRQKVDRAYRAGQSEGFDRATRVHLWNIWLVSGVWKLRRWFRRPSPAVRKGASE
jgi:hypothetical protein